MRVSARAVEMKQGGGSCKACRQTHQKFDSHYMILAFKVERECHTLNKSCFVVEHFQSSPGCFTTV